MNQIILSHFKQREGIEKFLATCFIKITPDLFHILKEEKYHTYLVFGVCQYVLSYDGNRIMINRLGEGLNITLEKGNHFKDIGYFRKGKKEGFWTSYGSNGSKYADGNFENGLQEGLWTFYNTDLKKGGIKRSEGYYKNGKKEGDWTYYHENGHPSQIGFHKNGETDGLTTLFYDDGRKKSECFYSDGKPVGIWEYVLKNSDGTIKIDFDGDPKAREIFADICRKRP